MAGGKAVVRAVTDEIMYAIMSLSGQEYVDAYAANVKAAESGQGPEKFPEPER